MVRAPHLYESLRAFCLAAFAAERGAELPFAFEEHATRDGPSLYEYRPLVRGFLETQAPTLRRLPDARNAIVDLRGEPAAAIFGRAHGPVGASEDDALFRSVLLPLLASTADRCGGFDWHDDAFELADRALERSLFGTALSYTAVAPLVGVAAGSRVDLGGDIAVRAAVTGELAKLWPESQGLLPPAFGRDVDRLCVLELSRELETSVADRPDAAAELADAVTALRLATTGAIAAGPVVFERLDNQPLQIAPLLPIAATQPRGESTRLDSVRGRLAADLRGRLQGADDDVELAEALDRWELSLFAEEPFRSPQVREALVALLSEGDGAWAASLRMAVLVGEEAAECAALLSAVREERLGHVARDAVRRALVATLLYGARADLVRALDETLLGLRPRPVAALSSATAA